MSINFNDAKYDSTSSVFNGGNAGIVENCSFTVEKKGEEDKEKAPEYKITFTDSNGGTGNLAFWYITEGSGDKTKEQVEDKQGKMLKHLVHAVCGDTFSFPAFESMSAALDGCMKILKGASKEAKLRVFANFGSTMGIKKYPQPRTWVPVVESMSVALEHTRLEAGNIDAMEALTETPLAQSGGSAAPSAVTDGWDED